jgi:signal transduction histidine kinase
MTLPPVPPVSLEPPAGPPLVLVVEDEEAMRDACTQILADQGYRVETADRGETGIRMARDLRPDLVVLDIRMPGVSGLDALSAITAADPAIVAIVITGYATVEYAVESMKRGAFDFLPKPFTPEELRVLVRRGLERRKLLADVERLKAEKRRLADYFVSIVSHQMRSPIAAVKQFFEVILGSLAGEVSPQVREILGRADTRLTGLLALIEDWLSLARFDPEKARAQARPLRLDTLVRARAAEAEPVARERGVELVLEVDQEVPPVRGNERALGEALANLLDNASKYNHPGGRATARLTREGASAVVRVSDTGLGVPPEHLPYLFDEFYRARTKETLAIPGTGLGLAIVRKIVESHGGTVAVESRAGEGSVFTITLPLDNEQTE